MDSALSLGGRERELESDLSHRSKLRNLLLYGECMEIQMSGQRHRAGGGETQPALVRPFPPSHPKLPFTAPLLTDNIPIRSDRRRMAINCGFSSVIIIHYAAEHQKLQCNGVRTNDFDLQSLERNAARAMYRERYIVENSPHNTHVIVNAVQRMHDGHFILSIQCKKTVPYQAPVSVEEHELNTFRRKSELSARGYVK
ncbi:hypothetical protein EVAR_81674_1 [Eumeta japonica]|uniref:Uncharacterized protein n=1 Tax=Eumeta variegata TaxID=151549 RepID=A0A4C1V4F6_EUMVA|nr:hypothetical protein EVAR_81674_1 [Eumeta japonica]